MPARGREGLCSLLGRQPASWTDDRVLHAERLEGNRQRTHAGDLAGLPDGTFVDWDGAAWLVKGPLLLRYTPAGYDAVIERPPAQSGC